MEYASINVFNFFVIDNVFRSYVGRERIACGGLPIVKLHEKRVDGIELFLHLESRQFGVDDFPHRDLVRDAAVIKQGVDQAELVIKLCCYPIG